MCYVKFILDGVYDFNRLIVIETVKNDLASSRIGRYRYPFEPQGTIKFYGDATKISNGHSDLL